MKASPAHAVACSTRPRPGAARPFVLINMAMTADAKIATFNRRVSSFGSALDREHLYELRATADAVMAGARTIDLETVYLGPGGARFRRERIRRGLAEHNLRIIVSGSGTLDPRAAIFRARFSPILVLTTSRIGRTRLAGLRRVADEVLLCGEREIDFADALWQLRQRWNVRRLLCEGGGELNAALFRAGLVDELHLTICAKIFGGRLAPTIAEGLGAEHLADAARLRLVSTRRIGDELFVTFRARA
jgi:riboflavin-specific deaminase-like protein